MRVEPVSFASDGRHLCGVLEHSEGEPVAGVVVVHGWGGCRVGPHRILVETARRLGERGLLTLRFDLSGRGESDGDPAVIDLDAMMADTAAALDELARRLPSGARLGLLGMCSGGNVALGTAGFRGRVAAVATWSTYAFQEQQVAGSEGRRTSHFALEYLRKALRPDTWLKLVRGRINFGMVRRVLFGGGAGEGPARDLRRSRRDVMGALSGYGGRAFFLFGGLDPEAAEAEGAFRSFCAQNDIRADFGVVEGANHNFYSLAWKQEAIDRTADWMVDALSGRPRERR